MSTNINKNLSVKYSQKLLDDAKQSGTDNALKDASKRAIQKTAEATSDLIGNKNADKITKVSISSPQNSLETVEVKQKIWNLIEKYRSPEKRQRIVVKPRLI